MGIMERMTAKVMTKTVRATLEVASDQKLLAHLSDSIGVIENTDDFEVQGMLQELVDDIHSELKKRGHNF